MAKDNLTEAQALEQAALVEFAPAPKTYGLDSDFLRSLGLPGALPRPVMVFQFPDRVRRAFRAPTRRRVSEWAEKHFIVVEGSRPGPWRNANAPYLAGIMDTWPRYFVREIVFVAAPQVGKSKVSEIITAWTVDQNPGPFQYILPDEQTAKTVLKRRFRPLFQQSPLLRGYTTGKADDFSFEGVTLKHMTVDFDWAGSVARLAAKAVRDQVYDELEKHPVQPSKDEASSTDLGAKRQRTFRDSKKLKISSPTTEKAPTWQAFQACSVRFYFHARCQCGHYQRLHLTGPDGSPRLCWPEGVRDPELIEERKLAWYECEHCGAKWDDHLRDKAVSVGKWFDEAGVELDVSLEANRPRKVGFGLSALYSPFVSLSEVAAAFLKAQGDRLKLMDFMNGYLAEPWVDYKVERAQDKILALRDDRPRGVLPPVEEVAALIAGVDTQDKDFVYVIRAFGYGHTEDTWKVREGRAPSFEALEKILWQDVYADARGNTVPVHLALIDSQGHRTKEVYDWTRLHRGKIYPLRGEGGRMTQPYSFTNIEFYPGTNIAIPGGIKLLRLKVDFYKNDLAAKLAIAPGDPGSFRLHADSTEDYAAQMCAEYFDDKDQSWKCPDHKPNHFWDCEVYILAGAHLLDVKLWPRPEQVQKQSEPVAPSSSGGGWSLPTWYTQRGGRR